MTEERICYSQSGEVATIAMNSLENMNALSRLHRAALFSATEKAKKDDQVKVVVITGVGNAFCAGGDIAQMKMNNLEAMDYFAEVHGWLTSFYSMGKPTIAAVNGFALGGGFGLALACDVIFAAQSAKFGLSFANVGLAPDYGLAYILPRIIGPHRTMDLFYTARKITAQEAFDMGIINEVLPDGELADHVSEYAQKLAASPALSYSLGKQLVHSCMEQSYSAALDIEAYTQSTLLQTEDHRNAAEAFSNKRKPMFRGK